MEIVGEFLQIRVARTFPEDFEGSELAFLKRSGDFSRFSRMPMYVSRTWGHVGQYCMKFYRLLANSSVNVFAYFVCSGAIS